MKELIGKDVFVEWDEEGGEKTSARVEMIENGFIKLRTESGSYWANLQVIARIWNAEDSAKRERPRKVGGYSRIPR